MKKCTRLLGTASFVVVVNVIIVVVDVVIYCHRVLLVSLCLTWSRSSLTAS